MCQDDFYSNLQTAKRKYMERQMISTAPLGSIYRFKADNTRCVKVGQLTPDTVIVEYYSQPDDTKTRINVACSALELIPEEAAKTQNKSDGSTAAQGNVAGTQAKDVPEKSDGSKAGYYDLPENAKTLQDLLSHTNMNHAMGEIFCATYRYGKAAHSDQLRDAKKIKFYIEAEIKRLEKTNGTV